MHRELTLIREIALWLWARHSRVASTLSGDLADVHSLVSSIYPAFEQVELELLFRNQPSADSRAEGWGKSLFLEPDLRHNIVPIMSFRYDFGRSVPEIRFQVALFTLDQSLAPRAIGYRFESPEGEGIHHYYHAQLITNFNNQPLPCPQWLPVKQPAFALDASDSVTLLVCILVSLYGLSIIRELKSTEFSSFLEQYVSPAKMMCLNPEFQPTYWEMRIGGEMVYRKTWKGKGRYKAVMRLAHGATDIREITRESYYTQDERQRGID